MLKVNILLLHSVCEGGDLVGGVETFVVGGVNPGELVLALLAPLVHQLLMLQQLLLLVSHECAEIVITNEGVEELSVLGELLQGGEDRATLTARKMMTVFVVILQSFLRVELALTVHMGTNLLVTPLQMIL